MFRRVATTSAISATAVRMNSTTAIIFPKVDFHKDVVQKHTPKAAFNPYAPNFMENLKHLSESASQPSNVGNGFLYHQHTGSNIMGDTNFLGH